MKILICTSVWCISYMIQLWGRSTCICFHFPPYLSQRDILNMLYHVLFSFLRGGGNNYLFIIMDRMFSSVNMIQLLLIWTSVMFFIVSMILNPFNVDKCNVFSRKFTPQTEMGCHGRDRMVVGFTNTCAISVYHH